MQRNRLAGDLPASAQGRPGVTWYHQGTAWPILFAAARGARGQTQARLWFAARQPLTRYQGLIGSNR